VLTAVALIPALNPDGTVVASKQATSTVPNVVGLVAGRAYRISDLFTALLTISANDAAIALTQATGSFGQGMALINAEARHLQAHDTVAVDPNGLDAPGQRTSAYDLALIARQALKLPALTPRRSCLTGASRPTARSPPVGTLVGPLQPPSSSPAAAAAGAAAGAAAAPPARAEVASGSHGGPSVLAAAGFSCAVVLAAVLGFGYSRRQKLRASRALDRPARDRV
jgi:D-alanyl-D-alanine carboxypeptidase